MSKNKQNAYVSLQMLDMPKEKQMALCYKKWRPENENDFMTFYFCLDKEQYEQDLQKVVAFVGSSLFNEVECTGKSQKEIDIFNLRIYRKALSFAAKKAKTAKSVHAIVNKIIDGTDQKDILQTLGVNVNDREPKLFHRILDISSDGVERSKIEMENKYIKVSASFELDTRKHVIAREYLKEMKSDADNVLCIVDDDNLLKDFSEYYFEKLKNLLNYTTIKDIREYSQSALECVPVDMIKKDIYG